jgi:hypothetical protein
MLKNLIKIASDLDDAGFKKEADIVDLIIRKVSSSIIHEDDADVPESVVSDERLKALLGGGAKATREEMDAYEDLESRILQEQEDEEDVEMPSDGDIDDLFKRLTGQTDQE